MQDFDVSQMIGPSSVMAGAKMELQAAIELAKQRFPGSSFCVVDEWVWVDFDAPDLVLQELAEQRKLPAMLLVFSVSFDSSTSSKSHWFRTTPLMDFSESMFFQTENKLYVLLGNGRRTSMPLSTLVRMF